MRPLTDMVKPRLFVSPCARCAGEVPRGSTRLHASRSGPSSTLSADAEQRVPSWSIVSNYGPDIMWDDGNRSSDEPRDVMSEKLTLVDSFRKLHPGPCAVVSTKLTSPCADAVALKALIAL